MSGFEVIGIILAIIPIFEEAAPLTHRIVGHVKTALSSERAASKLQDFCENLHYELSMLQMAMNKLVMELEGLIEEEKRLLLLGGSKLWTDVRVVRAVEDRLGAGNETFQIHLTKVLQQLNKLVTKDENFRLTLEPGEPVCFALYRFVPPVVILTPNRSSMPTPCIADWKSFVTSNNMANQSNNLFKESSSASRMRNGRRFWKRSPNTTKG
jgi:hypothetical protein